MTTYNWIILGILLCLSSIYNTRAQDVHITVPAENIFNATEFNTTQTVMNTNGYSYWRWNQTAFHPVDPTVRAIAPANFTNTENPGISLPASILQWRLASIGGQIPPFADNDNGNSMDNDIWPGFKHFTSSDQTWFEPGYWNEPLTPGNINFTFKIQSQEFQNELFTSGEYAIQISQNYGTAGPNSNGVIFTPSTFYIYLTIPEQLSWITASNTAYKEINTLDAFRNAPSEVALDLGNFDLGSTVDANLFAKAASSAIQFTSPGNAQETLDIGLLSVSGDSPNINTFPLSSTAQNLTAGSPFTVNSENRHNFQLQALLSKEDFKTHFFEAGTYTFQMNLKAKSTDNSIAKQQNIDYTLKVQPLSEINIPSGGSTINFEFNTATQYQQGQTQTISDQIKLSNNKNYELYVKSNAPFFKKEGVQSNIPASILQVGVDGGAPQVDLSTTPQEIIDNGMPVLDKNLTLKYSISAESAQTLIPKESGTYTTTITYSFTAL